MSDTKRLLSNSSIVFAGTMAGSVFSYLFNMLMGRFLGPVQYGEMTTILTFMTIISVGGGAVITVGMRYAGELYYSGHYRALLKLFQVFSRYLLLIAALIFILSVVLARPISAFFSLDSPGPLIIAFFSFFFSLTALINRGILQGTQRFLAISAVSATEMATRLIAGVLLVKLGFELYGAVLALVLSAIVAYLMTLPSLKRLFALVGKDKNTVPFSFNKKEMLAYCGPAVVATVLLTVLINVDILFVKHYFSAQAAGQYAAISTVSKIILYLTGPISSVMFPMIAERQIKGLKHYRTFLLSLLLTLFGALVVLAIYSVAPGTVMKILYGKSYVSLYYVLPLGGMYVVFYTLVNFLANYYLAIKEFFFIWLMAIVMLGQVIAVSLFHPGITEVIKILIASMGLLFALMMMRYIYLKKNQFLALLASQYGKNPQALDNSSSL